MSSSQDSGEKPTSKIQLPARSLSVCSGYESYAAPFPSPTTSQDITRSFSLSRIPDTNPRRRHSLGDISRDSSRRSFAGVPGEETAQIGDIGDRILDGKSDKLRESWRKGSIRLSHDLEHGALSDEEDRFSAQIGDSGDQVARENEEDGFLLEQDSVTISDKGIIPLEGSGLPSDAIIYSNEEKISRSIVQPLQRYNLPRSLDHLSYLLHMAVFGILGVFSRHLMQELFGPHCLALTRDGTPLYLDLPANMVGSFFMGWFGLVFKPDVRHVSDHLAVGLTTGFMGSLTTFSGWNQKMLDLSAEAHWTFAIAGILFGFFLVNESFNYGVASAEYLRQRFSSPPPEAWSVRWRSQHFAAMAVALLLLCVFFAVSAVMVRTSLDMLWVACFVGPPGVWLRWYLARFNGRGIGSKGHLKWLPAGTLTANVIAAILMAALSTAVNEVDSRKSQKILHGLQFGLMGCLSTVSTFAAEVYAMRQGGHEGRAVAYAAATFIPSFAVGTLIYSVPVWARNSDR